MSLFVPNTFSLSKKTRYFRVSISHYTLEGTKIEVYWSGGNKFYTSLSCS